MTKAFLVLAACIDARSGQRFGVGDTFNPAPTVEQAERLVAAGCLPKSAVEEAERIAENGGVDPAAVARAQLNHDGLFDKSDAELERLIESEGVTLNHDELREGARSVVIAQIRAHRASQPASPDPANVGMRTEAGELAQREADQAATDAAAQTEAAKVDAEKPAAEQTPTNGEPTQAEKDAAAAAKPLEAREAGTASDRYVDQKPAKAARAK